MALSGCVSSVSNELDASDAASPAARSNAQASFQANGPSVDGAPPTENASPADGTYRDPAVTTTADRQSTNEGQNFAPGNARADMAGLTMQPTGVNASSASIFAAPGSAATAAAGSSAPQDAASDDGQVPAAPAYVPVPEFNPAVKSMYSSTSGTAALPLEGSMGAPSRTLSQQAAALAEAQAPASPEITQTIAPRAEAVTGGKTTDKPEVLTLAAFFAGKRKARDKANEAESDVSANTLRTITASAGAMPQQAIVSGADLGDLMPDNFLDDDEFDDGHAEPAEGLINLASLPGMTRQAPNGLVLQTPKVEVSCIKPALVRAIKSVEAHYGRSAVVTSGYRPAKHNRAIGGRRGSLHTTCEAVDIQIPGVSKWELANFLRARPDRGGVGTYCHTESVHLDIGEARDWNWRCRRKK